MDVPSASVLFNRIVLKCLAWERDVRWQSALDLADALRWIGEEAQSLQSPFPVRRWPTRAAWALAAIGAATAIGALTIPRVRATRASDAHSIRFTLAAPPNAALPRQLSGGDEALSLDGRWLAFVADRDGRRLLWVQSLDALEAQPLPGTDGASRPFWAPDNRTLAFFAEGTLKAISAGGGPTRTLCDVPGSSTGYGGSWSPDGGTIVFSTIHNGLLSIPATGGQATPLTKPDVTREEAHLYPTIMPDGQHVVYISVPSKVVWLESMESKASTRLLSADSKVEYVEPGYLVFVRRGTLMAQRFDAQRAALVGEAIPIVEGVMVAGQGYDASFSASRNGSVLAYRSDPQKSPAQLTWVDRTGRPLGVVGKPGRYRNPELSPDGTSVALEVLDSQLKSDVWRLELERGVMTRLTSDPGEDTFPVWSRDGRWVMFSSDRDDGVPKLYRIRADGIGGEELVYPSSTPMVAQSWGLSGQPFVYQSRPAFNLGLLPLVGGGSPRLFDESRSGQGFGQVSPDGHWLAYASTEAGSGWDVYVQSFPLQGRGKWRISKDGGASPRWSRDGHEIFFYATDRRLMAVPVTSSGSGLEIGTAVSLFEASLLGGPPPLIPFKQQYDVTIDGRFLLSVPVEHVSDQSFTVVVDWTTALTR
jgi:Tol biopolymer transport system component